MKDKRAWIASSWIASLMIGLLSSLAGFGLHRTSCTSASGECAGAIAEVGISCAFLTEKTQDYAKMPDCIKSIFLFKSKCLDKKDERKEEKKMDAAWKVDPKDWRLVLYHSTNAAGLYAVNWQQIFNRIPQKFLVDFRNVNGLSGSAELRFYPFYSAGPSGALSLTTGLNLVDLSMFPRDVFSSTFDIVRFNADRNFLIFYDSISDSGKGV